MNIIPITRNNDFLRLYRRGKTKSDPSVVIYLLPNKLGVTRLGLTTSKKIGNAVERNRARRVIRAAAEMLPEITCGCDIVFVASSRTIRKKSTEIYAVMKKQLLSEVKKF